MVTKKTRSLVWLLRIGGVVLLMVSFAAGSVFGAKLYRYRDESGTLSFSDRPPAGDIEAEVRRLKVGDPPGRVDLRNLGTDRNPVLEAINDHFGPIEMEVILESPVNIFSDPPLPRRLVIPAASELFVAQFGPAVEGEPWSYAITYRWILGDPAARHRPSRPYAPPLPPGERFVVTQAFMGEKSHQHPQSRYAVDIAMPEGTPVHAARGGIVMEVANDYFENGTDLREYAERANHVRILHEDGTMGVYAHLRLETSQVVVGTRVSTGQFIAESGNTGFSTGPHLHFVVQKNAGMELVSLPFEFEDGQGEGRRPEEGMVLSGNLPETVGNRKEKALH